MPATESYHFPIGYKARTEQQILDDGARPDAAAQMAQLESWIETHILASFFPMSLDDMIVIDEADAYGADGFMTAMKDPAGSVRAQLADAAARLTRRPVPAAAVPTFNAQTAARLRDLADWYEQAQPLPPLSSLTLAHEVDSAAAVSVYGHLHDAGEIHVGSTGLVMATVQMKDVTGVYSLLHIAYHARKHGGAL